MGRVQRTILAGLAFSALALASACGTSSGTQTRDDDGGDVTIDSGGDATEDTEPDPTDDTEPDPVTDPIQDPVEDTEPADVADEADATEEDTEPDVVDDPLAEPDVSTDVAEDPSEDVVTDTGTTGGCPPEPPETGTACDADGVFCQYGDDPRRECRPVFACRAGNWVAQDPRPDLMCDQDPPSAECPASYEDASGQVCEVMDAYCTYDGLICHCTNCVEFPVQGCFGDPTWMCERANDQEGCPEVRANLGTSCSEEALRCVYECGTGGATVCTDGVWARGDGSPCPVSTRDAKENIVYLDDIAVDAIAAETLALPLTTWEYIDPRFGQGTHMGIIVEDAGDESFAVDAERRMVDLYGYTSMLLATVQAQQRQIEELQRQVEILLEQRPDGSERTAPDESTE